MNHCNDDESCCDDNTDCCDEIVQQVKIAKDFTSSDIKVNLELGVFMISAPTKFANKIVTTVASRKSQYATNCYFPPPEDFQILYSTFLI